MGGGTMTGIGGIGGGGTCETEREKNLDEIIDNLKSKKLSIEDLKK